jgi:hypothetical protein
LTDHEVAIVQTENGDAGADRLQRQARDGRRARIAAERRAALGVPSFIACTAGAGWGAWRLFTVYYFHSKSLFVLHDLSNNVTINTGKTLTPELICEILGLKDGINLFSVPIEQRRKDLLEQARTSATSQSCGACPIN